jgi:CHAT domain-containing protein/tetratricopeptide (TPR) repeat protein
LLLLHTLPTTAASLDAQKQRASHEDCDALVRDHPKELASFNCYSRLALQGQTRRVARRLEAILARTPDEPRASMILGIVRSLQARYRSAERLFRDAARGMKRERVVVGEVEARTFLAETLFRRGRHDEAKGELELAARLAATTGDPVLLARVYIWRGHQAFEEGDPGRSMAWMKKAAPLVLASGPPWLQRVYQRRLGYLYRALGRHREAFAAAQREAELVRTAGTFFEPWTLHQLAVQSGFLVEAGDMSEREWDRLIEDALRAALRRRNPWAEADVRLLRAARDRDPARAAAELRKVLAYARGVDDYGHQGAALRLLGKALFHAGAPAEDAFARIEAAIAWARSRGDRVTLAASLLDRASLRFETGPRDRAIRESLEALELIERVRGQQPEHTIRARIGAGWAYAHHLVSGYLLGTGSLRAAALALEVMERARARTLLEVARASRSGRGGPASPLHEKRRTVLSRIAGVQRRLVDADLPAVERPAALRELERLEGEEETLRDEIARADPALAAWRAPPAFSVDDVQRALSPGQALLAFQLAPRVVHEARLLERAGSWVLVITRDALRVHRLPSGEATLKAAALFPNVVARRDGLDRPGAVRLYGDLLAAPLADLTGVKELLLVPDGVLHRLPFGALRSAHDAPPLAERYRISFLPSVALWMRWKKRGRAPLPGAALVFADPELPTQHISRLRLAAPWLSGLRLGRLPHGRAEGKAVVRHLPAESKLLLGGDATEHFLKTADLRPFGVLHFAAHAVVDEGRPERSAVVLAPGDGEEDGLLQAREVEALDLRGRLIVLSACRSSSGAVLRGEGVMSLTRAFLQAGAHAVVGSLWPLRDDEASGFVAAFYRRLGEGGSVSAALRAAGRDRMRAGAPPAAWAGFVVVGNGELTPFPGGVRSFPLAAWVGAGLGGLAVLLLLALARRSRNRLGPMKRSRQPVV